MGIVQYKFRDITVAPDKYNTGCNMSLITTVVDSYNTIGGIEYKQVSGNTRIGLDLEYTNGWLGDNIVISNTSFPVGLQKLNDASVPKTVIFNNCYISGFYANSAVSNIRYFFNNCTVGYSSVSYATYNWCKHGMRMGDGFNPYIDVYVNNCYIYDLNRLETTEGSVIHADGFQIPDSSPFKNERIHFNNCRIADPQFPIYGQIAGCYVSSGFAITPNVINGADDIVVRDCIVNGGGYSIYLTQSNKTNVVLDNIWVGNARKYGMFYNNSDYTGVSLSNVINTPSLYIASVIKDSRNHTIISVTNDTGYDRDLIIYTNNGFQVKKIPRCPSTQELEATVTDYSFDMYQFDIQIDIGVVDFMVAFDTYIKEENQIRFVNYLEIDVDFPDMTYVQKMYRDNIIIPDKYNTGCDMSLITTTVDSEGIFNGIYYGTTAVTRRSFEFQYTSNNSLPDTILIENTFFPNGLQDLNVGSTHRNITFKNCYFMGRYQTPAGSNNDYIYEDCTFEYCSPSYSTMRRCKFLRTVGAGDGINPYRDVYIYDSFIYDLVHLTTNTNVHCDGVQIFGHSTTPATNIHIINCRGESPVYPIENQASGTYSNAPIMIQLEYSNGDDISFEDCVINGGGYSIYAHAVTEGLTLNNILLNNIKIGHAHQFGDIYNRSTLDENVKIMNLEDTNMLYVSSSWIDQNGHTHISVTNDTIIERKLIVYTNIGTSVYTIPACYASSVIMQQPISTYYSYVDYPFDIDIDCGIINYAVCFDESISFYTQIRFINNTEENVLFPVLPTKKIEATTQSLIARRNSMLKRIYDSRYIYNVPLLQYYNITSGVDYISTTSKKFLTGYSYNIRFDYEIECTSYTSGSVRSVIYDSGGFSYAVLGSSLSSASKITGTVNGNYTAIRDGGIKIGLRFITAVMTCNVKITNLIITKI